MRVEFKSADEAALAPGASERSAVESLGAPASTLHRLRGPGARLVAELLELAGGHGTLLEHREHAWASVTFSGTRHELAFRFEGDAAVQGAETLIAALPDHEFTIPRRLVADSAVVEVNQKMLPEPLLELKCEVLLLVED